MKSGSLERPLIMSVYPKSRLSIAVLVGGLAVFVVFASFFMVSFYGINHLQRLDSVSVINGSIANSPDGDIVMDVRKSNSRSEGCETLISYTDNKTIVDPALRRDSESVAHHSKPDVNAIGIDKNQHSTSQDTHQVENVNLPDHPPVSKTTDMVDQPVGNRGSSDEGGVCNLSLSINGTNGIKTAADPIPNLEGLTSALPAQGNINEADSSYSDCDLYHGKWVYDSSGPLYSNNSCPVLSEMQNCQRNGRPDKEYENWRWKPEHCDLPRFDAKKFLELMRGKTLAFIGDSVARNQMESMLCMLWQVEVPKNRGNKKMHRYYFRSTSTMIVRIWSSWLVRKTSEPFDFAPEGLVKLHLDAPDNFIMEVVPQFDVIVLSSGHWFTKHSAYILNNEILGGQLWWPDKARPIKINNVEAFGISTETILTSLVTHPNYTGLTIARTYSPDHYKGGAWNTGGSCSGKTKPALDSEIVENHFTKIMHDKQVNGFKRALTKKTNKSRFKLMDITEAFGYRHDGHPGPYRSPDSNKITKVGTDSKPPPEDCLHWCMPGPVDTWNELLMEIITKEFESNACSS